MAYKERFNVVLVEPEIPPNTGNIARLCAATNTTLHLVGKLGFSLDDKYLKRAGLDYWHAVDLRRWNNLEELQQESPNGRWWFASKKAQKTYLDANYRPGDFLVFGKESLGLPDELIEAHPDQTIRIPIYNDAVRSYNIANSVAIILHEALRQNPVTSD